MFESFTSWSDVLGAADRGTHLWYHAPMDIHPACIRVARIYKNGKIKVVGLATGTAFTADSGHLTRFRKRA